MYEPSKSETYSLSSAHIHNIVCLRYDLTDIARIAFMFHGGQSPASILSPICTHSNRLNHEKYPEPCFPAPQLYLLSHTLIPWDQEAEAEN